MTRIINILKFVSIAQEAPEAALVPIFNKFDKNGDGKISCNELRLVFRDLGWEMRAEEVQTGMSEFDKDGDGHIDLEEFMEMMKCKDEKVLRDAFDLYDLDKDGLISTSELHEVLNRMGENYSLEQCNLMITKVDADGDGFVNFPEFKEMMKRR
ncbi:hypothetical protein M0R45_035420 [Rubus argutus]|uniref:EF-hand domain-containing protein n=1 Tax=Rubus argutus TaxID=59490 RepID=A0AAW1VWT2_RUBAR